MRATQIFTALLLSTVFAACGGGGSSGDDTPSAPTVPPDGSNPVRPDPSSSPTAPGPTPIPTPEPPTPPTPPEAPPPAPPTAPPPAPPPPTSSVGPTGSACLDFYAANATLKSGQGNEPIAALPRPAKGTQVREPAYGTCVVRVTDHAQEPPANFARNDYSRRQAFNADNTRMLVNAGNGYWHLYDPRSYQYIGVLNGPAGDAEPQWDPVKPNLMTYLPRDGVGMQVRELDVSTGKSRLVADLSARLQAQWPTANGTWTKSEGSPSADGRYWCLMVDDAKFNSLGVVTWDRATDTLLGSIDTKDDRPDHVSMSPSGNWCVVSGDGARGTVAYSRDFANQRKLHTKSEHSDLAITASGDDVYVAVDYQSNGGEVFMVNFRTGVRTGLFDTYIKGTVTSLHFSGKGYAKPGWVVISSYGSYDNQQWLHNKVMAVQLQANPTIYTLARHRSQINGYWTEPQASVSRDFSKIVFSSNWGSKSDTDVDTYMVEIPSALIQ